MGMGSRAGELLRRGLAMVLAAALLSSMMGGSAAHDQMLAAETPLQEQFYWWAPNNVKFPTPDVMTLTLDALSAAGGSSKKSWMYGEFSADIMLPPGDSAGTVTTFYLSSSGDYHCEVDVELLGNKDGHPHVLHTNVYLNGIGGREQQIYLWFDPSTGFHNYKFQWSKDAILFLVDGVAVRVFKNVEGQATGLKYLNQQAMSMHFSLWDGSTWATDGGRVPLDWKSSPFVASYKAFSLKGCEASAYDVAACQSNYYATGMGLSQKLVDDLKNLKANAAAWRYNYCDDRARYPEVPVECPFNHV